MRLEAMLQGLEQAGSESGFVTVGVRTRKQCDELAPRLQAECYQTGSREADKHDAVARWQSGVSRVLVGTTAFGLGMRMYA